MKTTSRALRPLIQVWATCFLISLNAFANSAPESIVRAMIAGEQVPGKECKDIPEEKCIYFGDKDLQTVDLIDGELVENPDKKFAKELAEKNAKDAAKAKEDKCKNFTFKGTTIAQLKQELNDERECRK